MRKVVIVGGGTAGWISAAVLVRLLGRVVDITLVESEDIGIIGVGEATIPPILSLNRALGLDEAAFLRHTRGTIKLGIEFQHWGRLGDSYMHAFGGIGKDFPFCPFHHVWNRMRLQGAMASLWDFSPNYQAAKQGKFAPLERLPGTDLRGLAYAYHFDASLYAGYLREYCEARGVRRREGRVAEVVRCPDSGELRSLSLADGGQVAGDFFVDCSGFRALLMGDALGVGYEDWSRWLPCDRALALPTEAQGAPEPYTRAIAHGAGWRWHIPLQHRVGNGLVYSSAHLEEDAARQVLLGAVAGRPLAEPRPLRFLAGRRERQWQGNCVAIGLASGFLEPLESTSIHLVQAGIIRLVKYFPRAGLNGADIAEYNRLSQEEFEHIRDFIIAHYKLNARGDSEFWRYCAAMDIPDSLAAKLELFRASGRLLNPQEALFQDVAWQQVLTGQGLLPADYHPLAATLNRQQLAELAANLKQLIATTLGQLPRHEEWLARTCGQPPEGTGTAARV